MARALSGSSSAPSFSRSAAEASAYEAALAANVASDGAGYPSFDACLIGVGLDGHVGSIYPNIADVESTRAVVPITGSIDDTEGVSASL